MHNTTDINASIVSEDNKLGLAVFGQNTAKDAWDANGDGFTELSKISGQTVGFRGYLKTSLYSKLTAEYHHLEEFRRGGVATRFLQDRELRNEEGLLRLVRKQA